MVCLGNYVFFDGIGFVYWFLVFVCFVRLFFCLISFLLFG